MTYLDLGEKSLDAPIVAPRLEAELLETVSSRHRDQSLEEGLGYTTSLEAIDDCDCQFGTPPVVGDYVAPNTCRLVTEGRPPGHMPSLVHVSEVIEFSLAETSHALAKTGEPAVDRQLLKTLLQELPIGLQDRAECDYGPVLDRHFVLWSVGGEDDSHRFSQLKPVAVATAHQDCGGNFKTMARRRLATATSDFGSGKRESHDSASFYARFSPPVVSHDERVSPPVLTDTLFCGDAREMTDDQVADRSVALVVTSPPYFTGKEYETNMAAGNVPASYVEYLEMLREVFAICLAKLEPGGRIAINVANLGRKPYRSLSSDVIAILQDDLGMLLRGEVIWQKARGAGGSCAWGSYRSPQNPVLRDVTERVVIASRDRFDRALKRPLRQERGLPHEATIDTDEFLEATLDVWEMPAASATRIGHPAPFPVELPRRIIELYTYRDDLVLDPFIGSGTTAVAAVESGRHYVGFDTEPAYIDLARERIEKTTGRG